MKSQFQPRWVAKVSVRHQDLTVTVNKSSGFYFTYVGLSMHHERKFRFHRNRLGVILLKVTFQAV
jgi:hypothetical protein